MHVILVLLSTHLCTQGCRKLAAIQLGIMAILLDLHAQHMLTNQSTGHGKGDSGIPQVVANEYLHQISLQSIQKWRLLSQSHKHRPLSKDTAFTNHKYQDTNSSCRCCTNENFDLVDLLDEADEGSPTFA